MDKTLYSVGEENIKIPSEEPSKEKDVVEKEKCIGIKKPIPFDYSENIKKNEVNKSVGKIEYNIKKDGQNFQCIGSCFICNLPRINKIFLITNNHVFGKEELDSFNSLDVLINDKIKQNIDLSKKRFKYTNNSMDYTVIEILESDFVVNFLNVDDNIFDSDYTNEPIYNLGFPLGKQLNFSTGNVKKIQNKTICYNLSTLQGSSGSPILLERNHRVIGIHRGSATNFNVGISIKEIIEDILKKNPNIETEESEKMVTKFYYKSLKCFIKKKFFFVV